jgi:protein-disulfide isomerase
MNPQRLLVIAATALALTSRSAHAYTASGAAKAAKSAAAHVSPVGTLGPANAPATLVVFSDFACPYSAQTYYTLEKLEAHLPGQLRILFKQSPLAIHPDAPLAHRAALAAGRQGRYKEMADLLYGNQAHLGRAALMTYARQIHLDMPRFTRDLDSAQVAAQLDTDMEESRAFAVDSTPTMFLNGRELVGFQTEQTLTAAIRDAVANETNSKGASGVAPEEDAALPADVQSAMFTAPTAVRGADDAPLTIVEFTDFQCPYCRAAVQPMEQFLAERGKQVRWIFRAFPLDFHPDAQLAAEAALAAGAQGKFWPMHDLLFANQSALKPDDLRRYAEQIHLDMAAFDNALRTHTYAGQIAADHALGIKAGITGTPTFVIDGHAVSGVRSLPELSALAEAHAAAGKDRPVVAVNVKPAEPSANRVLGDAEAPLTLTWFTDVRSPLAAKQAELVRGLAAQYPKRVRVLYKAFPLESYPDSQLAAQALLAAAQQNAFWPMFDALAQQRFLLDRAMVLGLAGDLHLDREAFDKALTVAAVTVNNDRDEATRRGILGAPVIYVAEDRVDGLQNPKAYTGLIDGRLRQLPPTQIAAARTQ